MFDLLKMDAKLTEFCTTTPAAGNELNYLQKGRMVLEIYEMALGEMEDNPEEISEPNCENLYEEMCRLIK